MTSSFFMPTHAPLAVPRVRSKGSVLGAFRTPGRPLALALVGLPVFWVLGLGEFVWIIVSVPMAVYLWRKPGPVRVPPYFGVWLALIVLLILGGAMIGQPVPGTLDTSGGLIGWTVRVINVLAATTVLLYVGNISESELPSATVIRMLGFLFGVTVVGGLLGTLFSHVSFTSPFELILPHSIRASYYVKQLVHPGFAQVQDVLGYTAPRPKAPFAYTNSWGNNLSLLVIWFVVGWWVRGSKSSKALAAVAVAVAAVPLIYSLNRGIWIGVGLSVLYLAFHLAARGRLGMLAAALGVTAVAAVVFTATPLKSVVTDRLAHPHSNSIRSTLDHAAITAASESPVIGWGTTRSLLGSPDSIAVGKTSSCPTCGNAPIGSTGELWTLLIANGYLGATLFVLFFLLSAFRYRHDKSPEGLAARLILYLAPFYALFYNAVPTALTLTFISLGLLWRRNSNASQELPVATVA